MTHVRDTTPAPRGWYMNTMELGGVADSVDGAAAGFTVGVHEEQRSSRPAERESYCCWWARSVVICNGALVMGYLFFVFSSNGSVVSENQYAPVEWFIGTLPVYVRNAFVWVLVFELLQGNCCAPVALTSGRPTKTHLVSTKLVSELQPEPEPEPEVEPTVAFTSQAQPRDFDSRLASPSTASGLEDRLL